jgi:acetoin utilization protein AcuB
MIVDEVMTREPYAAKVADSIRQVLHMLIEADVRHIPVVDEGALVGIVSDRDLRGLMPTLFEEYETASIPRTTLSQPISSFMNSNVISVYPETELAEAVDLMIEHKVGAVPVVEADSSKLVGIVTYVDALRAARDEL